MAVESLELLSYPTISCGGRLAHPPCWFLRLSAGATAGIRRPLRSPSAFTTGGGYAAASVGESVGDASIGKRPGRVTVPDRPCSALMCGEPRRVLGDADARAEAGRRIALAALRRPPVPPQTGTVACRPSLLTAILKQRGRTWVAGMPPRCAHAAFFNGGGSAAALLGGPIEQFQHGHPRCRTWWTVGGNARGVLGDAAARRRAWLPGRRLSRCGAALSAGFAANRQSS